MNIGTYVELLNNTSAQWLESEGGRKHSHKLQCGIRDNFVFGFDASIKDIHSIVSALDIELPEPYQENIRDRKELVSRGYNKNSSIFVQMYDFWRGYPGVLPGTPYYSKICSDEYSSILTIHPGKIIEGRDRDNAFYDDASGFIFAIAEKAVEREIPFCIPTSKGTAYDLSDYSRIVFYPNWSPV